MKFKIFLLLLFFGITTFAQHSLTEKTAAVRIVRFQIDYPSADIHKINHYTKWTSLMRKSVLASLRFIDKHWKICDKTEDTSSKKDIDCGQLQVTGEIVKENFYRINATFIANRDPIRNTNVDATSTVFGVIQIGLRGGIFQYTNALKILGKPSPSMWFEEAFFCYPGFRLTNNDKCINDQVRRQKRGTDGVKTQVFGNVIF
jgi:hypothetical protein